jgi:hypothetical protein
VTVLITTAGAGGLPLLGCSAKDRVDCRLGVAKHAVTVTTTADTVSNKNMAIGAIKIKGRIVVRLRNETYGRIIDKVVGVLYRQPRAQQRTVTSGTTSIGA